ncbi:unnamed protein product, partial [marine sediment metagenome]
KFNFSGPIGQLNAITQTSMNNSFNSYGVK